MVAARVMVRVAPGRQGELQGRGRDSSSCARGRGRLPPAACTGEETQRVRVADLALPAAAVWRLVRRGQEGGATSSGVEEHGLGLRRYVVSSRAAQVGKARGRQGRGAGISPPRQRATSGRRSLRSAGLGAVRRPPCRRQQPAAARPGACWPTGRGASGPAAGPGGTGPGAVTGRNRRRAVVPVATPAGRLPRLDRRSAALTPWRGCSTGRSTAGTAAGERSPLPLRTQKGAKAIAIVLVLRAPTGQALPGTRSRIGSLFTC